MGAYVDIVRHFRSTTEDAVPSGTRRLLRSLRPEAAPTWDSLLNGESAPIVLLAPSGTGKTTELKQQAARMRRAQRVVIYAEAAAIVDGIEGGLWKDEHDVFVEWMRGTEPAVLFIDAVDELHRQQRKLGDLPRASRPS